MTICITGGSGFVGQGIVPALLEAGYNVRALVRSESSSRKLNFIPEEKRKKLTFVVGDPCNADDIAKAMEGCTALVHLVGTRRAETKKTGKTYEDIDVGSAVAAANALERTGIKRILLLSAAAIGNSFYVHCKAKAEAAIIGAGLDYTIFRPSFILAPGQQWPILVTPFLWLLGSLPGYYGDVARRAGNVSRKQLATAFIRALKDDSTIRKIYDVPGIRKLGQ